MILQKYLKYWLFGSISLAILALDQATKLIIHTQFNEGEKIIIWKGFFNLTHVRNYGGVFGAFSQSNEVIRTFLFLILPVLAFVVIGSIIYNLDVKHKNQLVAFSAIFGGALGNYMDRIHFGYVIDFLDFHIRDHHWPAFNVGDICIVMGVFCAVIIIYITEGRQPADQK